MARIARARLRLLERETKGLLRVHPSGHDGHKCGDTDHEATEATKIPSHEGHEAHEGFSCSEILRDLRG